MFWAKVRRGGSDECWVWLASTTGTGLPYGQYKLPRAFANGRQLHCYAHRMAWILTHGPIPDGLKVCHRCDNPICCNPTHLFLGTQAENLADCRAKGRMPAQRVKKLTLDDRVEIQRLATGGVPQVALARTYGVSKGRISRLVSEARSHDVRTVAPSRALRKRTRLDATHLRRAL